MKRILSVMLCLLLAGAVCSLAAVTAAAAGEGGITGPEVPLGGIGEPSSSQSASEGGIDLPPVTIDPASSEAAASSQAAASSSQASSKSDPIAPVSATPSSEDGGAGPAGSEATGSEDGEPVVTIGATDPTDESVPVDPEGLTPDGAPFPWVWVCVGGAAFVLAIVGGVLIYLKQKKA